MLTNAEFALISLLAERPLHGYAIEQMVEQRGMRHWTEIGFSSIYFLLKKLEARGLVETLEAAPSSRRTPRTYRPTEEGERAHREEARRALAEPDRPFSALPLGLANWPALPPEEAVAALHARRDALDIRLNDLNARRQAQEPLPPFVRAMFDYSTTMIAAERNWLAETIPLLAETSMEKIDLKKRYKVLYSGSVGEFTVIDVPPLNYFMIDGFGDPNVEPQYKEAVEALYAASYTLKFMSRDALGKDYVVPPLEGLWWAEDYGHFLSGRKDRWSWTMMIMVPDFIEQAMAGKAVIQAREKKGLPALSKLRFARLEEGRAIQTLHIGSYADEGPILQRLHEEFIPANGLVEAGLHHEIYLGDPRKTPAEKLKTLLRQPVRPAT